MLLDHPDNDTVDDPDDADELLDEDGEVVDAQEYDTMLRLERLETLEEEMRELGVSSVEEVRRKIAELHRELDEP